MVATELGIVIVVNREHPWNEFAPMLATEFPNVAAVKLVGLGTCTEGILVTMAV